MSSSMKEEERQLYTSLTDSLKKLTNHAPDLSFREEEDPSERLLHFMSEQIGYWLDHDFEQLLRVIYRIDIDEKHFRSALSSSNPANTLARLVLHRELQKVKTRIAYQKRKNHGDNQLG